MLNWLNRTKVPTVIALALLLGATAIGWYWVWGFFFLYWAIAAIVMGRVFVVQTVYRSENPALFWAIAATWIILSVITIFFDLVPPDVLPEDLRLQWAWLWE